MERREEILAATCAVICRDGLDGVRTSAIAKEAGVSSPIVHYYFPTLDDLVLASYRWDEDRFWGPFDEASAAGDPASLLHTMVVGVFERPDAESRAALRLWLEYARRAMFDPAIRELVALRVRRWRVAMEDLLTRIDPTLAGSARARSIRLGTTLSGWSVLLLLDVSDHGRAGTEAAVADCVTWRVEGTPLRAVTRRPARGESDRRSQLLDAALHVVAERGTRQTEFRAIAQEVGVSDALPRYYFPSRRELHEALLLHASLRDGERSAAAAAPFDDPRDRIRAMLARDLESADAHRVWTARVELLHLGYADAALRPLAALPVRSLVAIVAAELEEARRRGLAAPDLDPEAAALRLVALRYGAAPAWLIGAVDRDEFAQMLLAAIDDELGA
jgi:AcrR family transcriptional regulator